MSKSKDGQAPERPREGERGVEVTEKNTDTSWALFEAIREQQQRSFEKTAPIALEIQRRELEARGVVTMDDVLVEARRNNRVCPLPSIWLKLYEFLPRKTARISRVPATREEWTKVSALQKRSRLREHIEWAASQGVLTQVYQALKALPEDKWHHIGE